MSVETMAVGLTQAVEQHNAGVEAATKGTMDLALVAWEKALQADAGLLRVARNLAVAYEELGDYPKAARAWSAVLASEPCHTEALIRQATAFVHMAKADDAVANYERAIAIYPYFRFWYLELADLLEAMGRSGEAESWRIRAGRIEADEADMAMEDAQQCLRDGRVELAIKVLEAILDELPSNLEATGLLALALSKGGQHAQAIELMDQAMDRSDVLRPMMLVQRAALHLRSGHHDAALQDARAALHLAPRYGRAERLVRTLASPEASSPAAGPPPIPTGPSRAASLTPVSERGPWGAALREVLEEASRGRGRDGRAGRVGIVFQPCQALVPVMERALTWLEDRELGLRNAPERVWLGEVAALPRPGRPLRQSAWLGSPRGLEVSFSQWGHPPEVTQLEPLLLAAEGVSGAIGYHTVVVVTAGHLRGDGPHLRKLAGRLASERLLLLHLGTLAPEVEALRDVAVGTWQHVPLDR